MATMKMPCAVGSGNGGINLMSPDMVYPANGASAIQSGTTIQCAKKPRYIILSNANRQGTDSIYSIVYILDVENETCLRFGTYYANHIVYTDSAVAYSDIISSISSAGLITLNSSFFTSNTDSVLGIYY